VNEGGISSPFIVHWPSGIKDEGMLRNNPGHFVDLLPTLVDLAGGSPNSEGAPPRPGRSLAPAFRKDGAAPHEYVYFNHNNNRAIRVGDWKLIAIGEAGPWELYDLAKDRCEQHDLAAAQPELVKQLAATWKDHDEQYVRVRESSSSTTKQRMQSKV
jgi:arylsulfatase A-like enzyme